MKTTEQIMSELELYKKDVNFIKEKIDMVGMDDKLKTDLEIYQIAVAILKWVLE